MIGRRTFLSMSALGLAAQTQRRPNVVVFLADDMGWGDLGCFGAKDILTPHIDSLARDGVKLTDCYSNGPVCTPTRCGLMTGRYQQRYGKGLEWALLPSDTNIGLDPKHTTLPRLLKNSGYKTGLFGKWHLGRENRFNPVHHGFDEFFGLTGGNVDMYSKEDRFQNYDLYDGLETVKNRPGYLTEMLIDRAAQFITANRTQPFFACIPFNAVHWPFQGPGRPETVRTLKTWYDGTRAGEYKPMLEAMDAGVGRILGILTKLGLANDTLVIFTNDNGGERLSDGGPFRHHKATLWEGGIRVPGIVRWPGRIPRGRTSRQVSMSMDFTATIAAACGVTAAGAEPFDGVDLLPVWSGRQPEKERELCWRIQRAGQRVRAIRRGKWKYILDGNISNLYDLSQDPGETTDLFYVQPKIAAELRQRLDAWEKQFAG